MVGLLTYKMTESSEFIVTSFQKHQIRLLFMIVTLLQQLTRLTFPVGNADRVR